MKTYRVAALTWALLLTASGVAPAGDLPCAVIGGPGIADRQSTEGQLTGRRFPGEHCARAEPTSAQAVSARC